MFKLDCTVHCAVRTLLYEAEKFLVRFEYRKSNSSGDSKAPHASLLLSQSVYPEVACDGTNPRATVGFHVSSSFEE